jgi:hypothetical protein
MNAKSLLLGTFVVLTMIFASLTVGEYYQSQSKSMPTETQTSTTITTTTSTVICPSNVTCGSFTYTQDGQVRVDNVQAMESTTGECCFQNGGPPQVTFYVTVENIGNTSISFPSYALESSIATNDSVLQKQWFICQGCGFPLTENITLSHGQNYTLLAPYSYGDGYNYQLIDPGSVNMNFSFNWTLTSHTQPCTQAPCTTQPFPNSTEISAQFIFAPPPNS